MVNSARILAPQKQADVIESATGPQIARPEAEAEHDDQQQTPRPQREEERQQYMTITSEDLIERAAREFTNNLFNEIQDIVGN